ncbi:hypothetical protein, partial [Streptomyces rimosus]|uniref:hypothetical protein n=1 Tax=Streptomyces rimosus TaxID=1927 RepID=UPI0034522AA2
TGDLPPLFCVHGGMGFALPYRGPGARCLPRSPVAAPWCGVALRPYARPVRRGVPSRVEKRA